MCQNLSLINEGKGNLNQRLNQQKGAIIIQAPFFIVLLTKGNSIIRIFEPFTN